MAIVSGASAMLHWDLLGGPLPIALVVLAVAGGAFLLVRRGTRRWWLIVVPAVGVGSVAGALGISWYVDHVWQPFPDPLPGAMVLWCVMMLAGVGLLAATLARRPRWWRRGVAVVAALAIVAAGFNEVNQAFGYYPTLADVVGQVPARETALPGLQSGVGAGPVSALTPRLGSDTAPGGFARSLATGDRGDPPSPGAPSPAGSAHPADPADPGGLSDWRPSGTLPHGGAVAQVNIPGVLSGFRARLGWVYLPPAYFAHPRPDLPVLMLIAGQPGSPSDWIDGGHVVAAMDAFAVRHHGIAPIVVMPDANGSATADTMCLNSRLGNVDTYLSRDVPDWVLQHLQVDRDTATWAVGGFSFGGTCALQLAVAHPTLFPTFLDISGQVAPTLGRESRTVAVAFGGDAAAYQAALPLPRLAADARNPAMTPILHRMDAILAVGAKDRRYGPQQRVVLGACKHAGMAVHSFTVPGSHNWYVPAAALPEALPGLAARMGLT